MSSPYPAPPHPIDCSILIFTLVVSIASISMSMVCSVVYVLADILGNGRVHPADLVDGESWYRLYRGNEAERVARRLALGSRAMKEFFPTQHHLHAKRQRFLYKYYNHFRRTEKVWWWSERWPTERNYKE